MLGLACLMQAQAFVPLTTGLVSSTFTPLGPGGSCRPSAYPRGVATAGGAAGLTAMADGSLADAALLHQLFSGLADAADAVGQVTQEAAKSDDGGVFGGLVSVTESAITNIHLVLNGMGVESSYGFAIIIFTLFIKGITFPLTAQQLTSTSKMQALQPKVKEIQTKYANNPEMANQAISQLYQEEEVNPLAGCIPTLAQIPVFIALYRALLNLSKDNALNEPFLWLPNLEGPTYGAPTSETLNWLKGEWINGEPPLGWHDTLCFLSIPVILVITQSISTQVMQPAKQPGQEDPSNNFILKLLPLMIGWFSLNVPSGLGVYWIVNNFVSTSASVFIRKRIEADAAMTMEAAGSGRSAPVVDVESMDVDEQLRNVSSGLQEAKGFSSPAPEAVVAEGESDAGAPTVVDVQASSAPKAPKKSSKKKKKSGKKKR
ncbi:unnamed protein product [Chrysoparadoxa australica]